VSQGIAAVKLRRSQPDRPRGYRAPALGLLCLLGTVSSVAALVMGLIPPAQFGHSNPLTYAIEILAGILAIGIVPPLLMDRLRKPSRKAAGDGSARHHRPHDRDGPATPAPGSGHKTTAGSAALKYSRTNHGACPATSHEHSIGTERAKVAGPAMSVRGSRDLWQTFLLAIIETGLYTGLCGDHSYH
jgi:hypothetical protein